MNKKKATWECSVCGYVNNEQDEICLNCGSLREEPSYDQIADMTNGE